MARIEPEIWPGTGWVRLGPRLARRGGAKGCLSYTEARHVLLHQNRHVTELISGLRQRYRYSGILLRAMVVTDFKLRYQASLLGYLWTLLKPLALFTVLYLVFVRLIKLGHALPHQALSLLFGLVIWSFFAETTQQGLGSLVGRSDLLRKISFPRYVVVMSVAASALITLALSMVVIVLFLILGGVRVGADIFWLVPLFLELLAISLAFAFFLSALFVRFRDMSYIWEVLLQALFYAVPIIYPLNYIPVRYARIFMLNPVAQIVQDARYVLVTDKTETMAQLYGTPWVRAIPIGITLVLGITSVIFFRRQSPSFAEMA
jgi:ABC-2 type transport system permease protein